MSHTRTKKNGVYVAFTDRRTKKARGHLVLRALPVSEAVEMLARADTLRAAELLTASAK